MAIEESSWKAFVPTIRWCVPYNPGIRLLSTAIIFGKFKLNKTQVPAFGRLRRGITSRLGNLQTNMQPQAVETHWKSNGYLT